MLQKFEPKPFGARTFRSRVADSCRRDLLVIAIALASPPSPICLHDGGGFRGTGESFRATRSATRTPCHAACHAEIERVRRTTPDWDDSPTSLILEWSPV